MELRVWNEYTKGHNYYGKCKIYAVGKFKNM